MHSLRVKTTVITISIVLATLLAFSLASFFTVGQEATANSAEKMHLLSENAQQSLDAYLDGIEQSVYMAARIASGSLDGAMLVECNANKPQEDRSPAQTSQLDAYVREHCAHVEEAFGSVAKHTNGIVTYYYCINPEVSTQEHGFFYSKMGKVGFEIQPPLDARELDPSDLGHTTWYYTPIERGTPLWVGPYTAHFLGEVLTVSFLIPIYKSGILIGVMGMDILFDTMIEKIDSLKVYDSGYACLLDEEGHVLHHPWLEAGSIPEFASQVVCEGGFSRQDSGLELIRYEHEGEPWQLSFTTLLNGMKLVVTAPVSEVVATWWHLVLTIPPIAILILVILIPVTLLTIRAVIEPLQQLTKAANQLAAGDYDVELDYCGKDEVGDLTDAFRTLRDHVRIYISDINSTPYIDSITGVRNKGAFEIFSARLDDSIEHLARDDKPKFAIVLYNCKNLPTIVKSYGQEAGDAHLKQSCSLICNMYSHSSVFRVDDSEFLVVVEGRDYSNRDELLRDLKISADWRNKRIDEPWNRISMCEGMSTYRPCEDNGVSSVLDRARQRMNDDA